MDEFSPLFIYPTPCSVSVNINSPTNNPSAHNMILYQCWSSSLGWQQFSFLIWKSSSVSYRSWFFRLKKIFFIHIFIKPMETQTNFLYTWTPAKGRLNVPTALGHMLMSSAQRWLDNGCCGGTPLINPFQKWLRAAANDVTMWILWSCRLRWSIFIIYMWYAVNKLVYMTVNASWK